MRYLYFLLVLIICSGPFVPKVLAQAVEPSVETAAEEPVDILPAKAIYLGEKEDNGVIAKAWIYRVPQSELQTVQSNQSPFLLFVQFNAIENNVRIEKGIAAFKLESIEEERTRARKLEFKSGYFVAGLETKAAAYSSILVGCKLEDEKKRQYRYKMRTN